MDTVVIGAMDPPGGAVETTPTLVRARVQQVLRAGLEHPLTLVVAPAGSGKSTALRHLARDHPGHVAWYCPDATTHQRGLLVELAGALEDQLGVLDHPSVASLVAVLSRRAARRTLVVFVDDLHVLCGSPSEAVLEELVVRLPQSVRIVAATRRKPRMDLAGLLVSGHAVQVDDEVLRWRPWEVEQLFRDIYGRRLRPEEAARLCHRTEGWSAGLHLFHLATDWLDPGARNRVLTEMHAPPALVRDYLTRNVLEGLEPELQAFLLDTCVLGSLQPDLCDRLRGAEDSATQLAELEARRLFVVTREDGRGLRYHEVLRSYLEASLLERDGAADVRRRQGDAGRLLEEVGATADAVHAYVRAEDWASTERLLQRHGPALSARDGRTVLERLPRALVRADPWLQLMRARVMVGEGRFRSASRAYAATLAAFGRHPVADRVRRERGLLDVWLDDRVHPLRAHPNRSEVLRAALRAEPGRLVDRGDTGTDARDATDLLVAAALRLLDGSVRESVTLVDRAETAEGVDVLHLLVGRGLRLLGQLVSGKPVDPVEASQLGDRFSDLGLPWVARMCRLLAVASGPQEDDDLAQSWQSASGEDGWLPAIARLIAGLGQVGQGSHESTWLDEAATHFERLGAPVLEAWARSWATVARIRAGDPQVEVAAQQALHDAHALVLPGPQVIAEAVLGASAAPGAQEHRRRAELVAGDLGMDLPRLSRPGVMHVVERRSPATRVRCFGALDVCLEGRPVDLDALRPQVRQVLAMVAVRSPQPVHRERLAEALWPGDRLDTQARRLGVLVSTVRRHLEPDAPAGSWGIFVRVGEAYALRLPEGGYVDVAAFDDALRGARCTGRRDEAAHRRFLRTAFETCDGELLPEFGPAEWIVATREHYGHAYVDVARELASSELRRGRTTEAVEVARAGLGVDRHSDRLWHVLVAAYLESGDEAAAARARADHRAVLRELGVEDDWQRPQVRRRAPVTPARGTRAP